jgi:hypothetical protein
VTGETEEAVRRRGQMEEKDYLFDYDRYVGERPDIFPEVEKNFKAIAEELDDEMFRFIMSAIVL